MKQRNDTATNSIMKVAIVIQHDNTGSHYHLIDDFTRIELPCRPNIGDELMPHIVREEYDDEGGDRYINGMLKVVECTFTTVSGVDRTVELRAYCVIE